MRSAHSGWMLVGLEVVDEALLSQAFAGMDAALLQAVQANRKALQQFADQRQ